MRKPDEEVLEPDLSNENDELPKPPESERPKVDYGILIYVDELGEQGLEIIGKDRCNLNHLLALVENTPIVAPTDAYPVMAYSMGR